MNGSVWGVSRTTGNTNLGGNLYDAWTPTQLATCSGLTSVQPENDVVVCNGQVREGTNDNGTGDDAGDVSEAAVRLRRAVPASLHSTSRMTQGSHAAWPEFWMTDQPIPAPFTHEASSVLRAMALGCGSRRTSDQARERNSLRRVRNDSTKRFTVDSVVVVRDHVADDSFNGGAIKVTPLDCVNESGGAERSYSTT